MAEDFKAMKKYKQEKRASNRACSADLLTKNGVKFSTANDGAHLIINMGNHFIDFWPGTGKWMTRNFRFGVVGRGVKSLLKHISENRK